MEENTFRVKKKYVYAAFLITILLFGYFLYSLGARGSKSYATPNPQASVGNSDMSSHHKPAQSSSTGFFKSAVGKSAPEFGLQYMNGNIVKLSNYKGKNVVLFFNEGAMCYPACWNQISALANDDRFNKDDVVVFSIVVDTKSQWQQILKKVPQLSKSKILFDTSKKVSAQYDVLYVDSSMHKGSYPGHTYFIIDKEGVIRYALDDQKMAINNEKLAAELEKLL